MMPVRRYGALEMLADHLNRSRGYGLPSLGGNPEMADSLSPEMRAAIAGLFGGGGAPQQRMLPPGLPDAVQRSITEQPSYGEGQMQQRPWSAPWNNYSDFERENDLNYETWVQGGGRAARLPYELGMSRQFPEAGIPLEEGFTARPTDTPDPYSPRPNLGLGRGGYPWALY